jgi:hypothetical protein
MEQLGAGLPKSRPNLTIAGPVTVVEQVLPYSNGEVFVCQPGRTGELYTFRGVPGPLSKAGRGCDRQSPADLPAQVVRHLLRQHHPPSLHDDLFHLFLVDRVEPNHDPVVAPV